MHSDVFAGLAPDNHFHATDGKELFGVRRLVLREGWRRKGTGLHMTIDIPAGKWPVGTKLQDALR